MTQSKDTLVFNGFEPANTTPVPDVLFDELLSWLTGSELKVLLYIIRRTRGFKKDSDAISLSQFQKGILTKDGKQLDKGCGIGDRQTIIDALASLETKKCIVSEKGKTAKGDNATTVYRILFSQEVVGKTYQGSREKPTTPVGKANHRSMEKPTTVVGNSNPQETVIQDTVKQQTELQERESTAPESDTPTVSPPDVGDSRASSPQSDNQSQPEHTHEGIEHPFTCYFEGQYYAACPLQETPANTPTTPPAQAIPPSPEQAAPGPKGKGKKPAEPKTETPKSPPVEPPSDMAWGTRKCLLWFDYWRGGILIGKFKLMQASTCAKGLAEQFSEQQVIQARTDMEADPYYINKGGCDVCDVANNIHKYLKRKQQGQKPGSVQPVLKAVKRYSSYDDPNFRSDQDFYPVEGGSYAAVV